MTFQLFHLNLNIISTNVTSTVIELIWKINLKVVVVDMRTFNPLSEHIPIFCTTAYEKYFTL